MDAAAVPPPCRGGAASRRIAPPPAPSAALRLVFLREDESWREAQAERDARQEATRAKPGEQVGQALATLQEPTSRSPWTNEALATETGCSPRTAADTLMVQNKDPDLFAKVCAGTISANKAAATIRHREARAKAALRLVFLREDESWRLAQEEREARQEATRAKPGEKVGKAVATLPPPSDPPIKTREALATETGCSSRTAQDTLTVQNKDPDLFAKVCAGTISANKAAATIRHREARAKAALRLVFLREDESWRLAQEERQARVGGRPAQKPSAPVHLVSEPPPKAKEALATETGCSPRTAADASCGWCSCARTRVGGRRRRSGRRDKKRRGPSRERRLVRRWQRCQRLRSVPRGPARP